MAFIHSAISRKGLLLALLLLCITAFSSDASYSANFASGLSAELQTTVRQDDQDKKPQKTRKGKDKETNKPEPKEIEGNKRDLHKGQKPVKLQKPEIREVPKARKQLRPAAVKPKIKPVKIIKPKIKKH